jgi:hypothetical protein
MNERVKLYCKGGSNCGLQRGLQQDQFVIHFKATTVAQLEAILCLPISDQFRAQKSDAPSSVRSGETASRFGEALVIHTDHTRVFTSRLLDFEYAL